MSRSGRCVAALSLVMTIALLPASAMARPTVLIVPGDPAASVEGLDSSVQAAGFDSLVIKADELEGSRGVEKEREQAGLSAIGVGLDAARATYLAQDFAAMLEDLTRLRDETLWLTSRAENRTLLWELCFQIGLAHHSSKAEGKAGAEAAAREFALAGALLADKRPPRDVYGPDVVQAFTSAIASPRTTRPFAVTATPADARVSIDTVALVKTRGRSLAAGLHVVRVSAPGHRDDARIVDSATTATVTVDLEPTRGSLLERVAPAWGRGELRPGTTSSNQLLGELARERDAATIIWVAGGSPVDVIALDDRGNTASESAATARLALEAVLARLDEAGRVGKRDVIGPGNGGGNSGSNRKTWLIAGGVGVAIIAVVVTGIVLSRDGGGSGGGADRIEIGIVP